jgi:hypothetical protein
VISDCPGYLYMFNLRCNHHLRSADPYFPSCDPTTIHRQSHAPANPHPNAKHPIHPLIPPSSHQKTFKHIVLDWYTLWQTSKDLRYLVTDIIRKHPVLFFHAVDEERRPIRPSLLSILEDRAATFDEDTLRRLLSFAAYKEDDTTCTMLLDVAVNIKAGIKFYSYALYNAAT